MSHSITSECANVARLLSRVAARGDAPALIHGADTTTASALLSQTHAWLQRIADAGVKSGDICAFTGDFEARTVSLSLALMIRNCIQVPFSLGVAMERAELERTAGVKWYVDLETGNFSQLDLDKRERHPLIASIAAVQHPGLIVFTSGSSGKPKAILHDIDRVASKFQTPRKPWRMMFMLLIDHFGGFNTLLACLADGGVGICIPNRTPELVCRAVQDSKAELLPTTPTFLSMLIASELWRRYDLSSLKLVTYGAEPMPSATLSRMREILPGAEFKQTYGLSELGVLRSSSPDPSSLWLRIGGDGFETRVVARQLHIRSQSSMLGYLNAPSPIDSDGWMNTGDLVEEQNGLIRFLGRESEIINVGGQKVFPSEVEAAILEAPGVAEATVAGIVHPLLGNAVLAKVALLGTEDHKTATARLREHCRARLQKYKVPMRFEFVDLATLSTDRAKKRRTNES